MSEPMDAPWDGRTPLEHYISGVANSRYLSHMPRLRSVLVSPEDFHELAQRLLARVTLTRVSRHVERPGIALDVASGTLVVISDPEIKRGNVRLDGHRPKPEIEAPPQPASWPYYAPPPPAMSTPPAKKPRGKSPRELQLEREVRMNRFSLRGRESVVAPIDGTRVLQSATLSAADEALVRKEWAEDLREKQAEVRRKEREQVVLDLDWD
jgi:hypothetical protein